MKVELGRESDGRWIAEVPDIPGVMVYGQSREEAINKVEVLALRVMADHQSPVGAESSAANRVDN